MRYARQAVRRGGGTWLTGAGRRGAAQPRRAPTRLGGVLVVGFDTATPAVSVALHDGERVVSEAVAADGRRHGELLAPMIAKVLADAGASRTDLTAVAVGVGPGPYTGLRVGVVTARVLGAVLGIPVHGVCSLDVIAAAVARHRGGSSWWRPMRGAKRSTGPGTMPPAAAWRGPGRQRRVDPGAAGLAVAGSGGRLYPDAFGEVVGPAYPDARTLCAIVAGARRQAARPPCAVPRRRPAWRRAAGRAFAGRGTALPAAAGRQGARAAQTGHTAVSAWPDEAPGAGWRRRPARCGCGR